MTPTHGKPNSRSSCQGSVARRIRTAPATHAAASPARQATAWSSLDRPSTQSSAEAAMTDAAATDKAMARRPRRAGPRRASYRLSKAGPKERGDRRARACSIAGRASSSGRSVCFKASLRSIRHVPCHFDTF